MSLTPVVVLFQPETESTDGGKRSRQAAQLDAHGFDVQCCKSVGVLHRQLQQYAELPSAATLAVLGGPLSENCTQAICLRALYPQLPIITLVPSYSDVHLIQVLQSGADNYCLKSASAALLVATLFRSLRARNCAPAPSIQVPDPGRWVLREQAWILTSPANISVSLTTGERAFMLTLLTAPELRATRADLIAAVSANRAVGSASINQARLGVLVSRMRRKFQQHGIALPLKSVHNWGYMFAGLV